MTRYPAAGILLLLATDTTATASAVDFAALQLQHLLEERVQMAAVDEHAHCLNKHWIACLATSTGSSKTHLFITQNSREDDGEPVERRAQFSRRGLLCALDRCRFVRLNCLVIQRSFSSA